MNLRDETEGVLRSWNAYEIARGAAPVVDFDCLPPEHTITPVSSRPAVAESLEALRQEAARMGDASLTARLGAHLAYVRAAMGERSPIREYIEATQGCSAAGWSSDYVDSCRARLAEQLADLGVRWGPTTEREMQANEGALDVRDAGDAIREAASEFEPLVRDLTGSDAPFDLSIEYVNEDAYWSYWLDGAGAKVRLRINLRNARFTLVQARQFALHEVMGHGLQCASYSQQAATKPVPWVRVTSVHAQQQSLLEGLATALPLFVAVEDAPLTARALLSHYSHLVLAELHLAINEGQSVSDCLAVGRAKLPFWDDNRLGDALTDRGVNPLLRSYLWSYPAGTDWFVHLSRAEPGVISNVFRSAYQAPLTPSDLQAIWPEGPEIGGDSRPGHPARTK